jgi:hypothetical protein
MVRIELRTFFLGLEKYFEPPCAHIAEWLDDQA